MKINLFFLIIFFSVFTLYAQQEKSFNVSKGGKLEMKVNFGDIKIETGSSNQVIIKADDEWNQNENISYSGNIVKIYSDYARDYRINIPADFSVNLTSSGGDILIAGNVTGELTLKTAAGSISFKDVNGNVTASTGGGDISGSNVRGKLTINTAGGNINLNNCEGETTLNSAGGDIEVIKISKPASVNTGGGNINLGTVESKTSVKTGGGDVTVSSAASGLNVLTGGGDLNITDSKGDVSVTTGGGDIRINNKSGNIKIKTGSGDVTAEIALSGSGENSIITGNGDVKLYIPESANTTVRIFSKENHRGDVQIISDFSKTTENITENEMISVYKINNGGSVIDIKNGYGTVEIRKRK